MTATMTERDSQNREALKTTTRAMREALLERAQDLAREFNQARKAAQNKIVDERRGRGHPNKTTRGIYVQVGLVAKVVNTTVQLVWCRFNFNRNHELTKREIRKGLGIKYSIPEITKGAPYWAKDLIKQTEAKAAIIRKQQVLIGDLELAMRAVARGMVEMDRKLGGQNQGSTGGGQPAHDHDTLTFSESNARIAPAPPPREEWTP